MSMEPSFLPEGPPLNRTAESWAIEPGSDEAWGIRRQAAEIIALVLAGSAPEQARARDHLRKCVDANPGRPEIGLAEHLGALRLEAAEGVPMDPLPHDPHAGGAVAPRQLALPSVGQLPTLPSDVRRPVLHHRPTLKRRYGRADPNGLGGKAGDGS
ncbi:hypothetical protein QFZ79_001095 [Arthrobacter sp. V4I6]|nr:hypothetical protein [Arthrobacter sp. V1I7]MDQ0852984.1 hypothetical protein [Arthrobacter sp. V4I6]